MTGFFAGTKTAPLAAFDEECSEQYKTGYQQKDLDETVLPIPSFHKLEKIPACGKLAKAQIQHNQAP